MFTKWTCQALLVIGLVLSAASAASAQEIQWRTDYNKARQEAIEQGRPIVIDFTTDNCYWCRQLEARTFPDAEVIQVLNRNCIPLRIDANQHPQLVQALNIQSYPTIVYAASDGKILGYHEGFLEAPKMREHLGRLVAVVSEPEWMLRDYREATQAQSVADFTRTVSLLRGIIEDGKERPIQVKARKLLTDVEGQASTKLQEGQQLMAQGKNGEAYEVVRNVVKTFRGTQAARQGDQILVKLASRTEEANPARVQKARDLLAQARQDYRAQQMVSSIDRCETLLGQFEDLPEATEARQILSDIRGNPELAKLAADQMVDRLGLLYLGLAESWIQKGQPQQAILYLEKVVISCPNTRHATQAQTLLAQYQGPKKPASE